MAKVTAVAVKFKLGSLPPEKSHSIQDVLSLVPVSKTEINRSGWKTSTNKKVFQNFGHVLTHLCLREMRKISGLK